MMGALLAYDGAVKGRRTDGWTTLGTSADSEVSSAHQLMRDRARDLVRNNPHAAKGLSVLVANRIGSGIPSQAAGRNKSMNKRIDERWNVFVDNCDLTGKHDLYGLQSLTERTRCESGEALVQFIGVEPKFKGDLAFRLLVLEPDFIDDGRNEALGEGREIRGGIELDHGVPVAYWLFDAHPGDSGAASWRRGYHSTRVPASEILHYYKPLRPGQTRGITEFASVILRLRDLDDWHEAKLLRAKISACAVAAVTTPSGLPAASLGPVTTDSTGIKQEQFAPGGFHYFRPGENVDFFDPKPLDDAKFTSDELHAIAAGLNMPYELLTGDLSEVTYTSHRGGLVQFRGMVEADQWQMVIPQICDPIRERFMNALAGLDGTVNPNTPTTYTPPRFGLLDPAKEIPAMIQAIQGGVRTWPDTIRREGYDPDETLDEIEEWQRELEKRGIRMTSNPQAAAGPQPTPEPRAA